jgi:hypothetical protein
MRSGSLVTVSFAFLVSVTTLIDARQSAPGTSRPSLSLTSSSEEAKRLFRSSWVESQNLWPAQARRHIAEAVKADPQFALAQVYEVFISARPGAEREKLITNLLPKLASATPAELLLATYWRETAGGRAAAAAPSLRKLAEMAPGDREIAWMANGLIRAGQTAARTVATIREFLKQFPNHTAALNLLAYTLHAAGDTEGGLQAAIEQVKLLPRHRNALDTLADLYLLSRRPADALPITRRGLEVEPADAGLLAKLGIIAGMTAGPSNARAEFQRGLELVTAPASRLMIMNWIAATYAIAGDGKSALAEIDKVIAYAEAQKLPAEAYAAHDRAALIEAFLGNASAIDTHLTAAGAGKPPAGHYATRAIAYARAGNIAAARSAAAQYASMVAAGNSTVNTLNAFVALKAGDTAAAEKELSGSAPNDLLAKALRADVMLRKGQKAQAEALKKEILGSTLKLDGNPPIDYVKLVARLHAEKL